ncbi:MAG: leucine-rich repeat domain-containing protein, partial [Lachnospiraceae bacterium]|nr:leucine-rich repeat domain-containing protein [Lachnospiraceae bacterium]
MGKKVRKSISVLLLALAIAVTQIPASNVGAVNHSDFIIDGTTLISYEGTDYSVSIPRSVKRIAQNAFENNMVVERLTIPKTVEQIDAGAFAGCGNLKEINIPASVTQIGSGAFANCPKLSTILVDPANKQFQCVNGVLYNKDRTKLYQVLAGRNGSSYTFPDSVKAIEKYAFWGCDGISQIYFGRGLTTIPEYAFSNCKGLKSITIPNMAESIELKAFEDCVNLEEAYIPPSVISIHETAFDGCGRLKLLFEEGTVGAKFAETFETTNVATTDYEESENTQIRPSEAGRQTVSQNATQEEKSEGWVADVSNLDVTKLQDGMERAESSDVIGKTKIVSSQAVVFLDNTKMQVQSGERKASEVETSQVSGETSKEESRPATFYEDEEIVEKYVVVDGKTIADRAFYQNYDLKEYDIPQGIERIGDFAFAYTSLSSIQIPYGVKSIGYGAFYQCKNLSSITIPQTVSTIEPSAFEDTAWLENWRNGPDVSDFLVVGNGILVGYKGNAAKVILPENVRKIGANVFEGHSEIISVSLPDKVEEIGEEAFKDCTALKSVTGGNDLEKICDRAFLNCPLETIRIPASVTYMGLRAFDQDNNGKSDSVVFLGNTLPKISCEKTAARFTNVDYRKPVLNSVEVAV